MALNSEVGDIEGLLNLLAEYQWLYDFQLTQYITDCVWQNIPPKWTDIFRKLSNGELNQIPNGTYEEHWPESLKNLIMRSREFCIDRQIASDLEPVTLTEKLKRGMNPKKQHEVSNMAAYVHQICQESRSDHVLDVGSGLGYLGHVLSREYGYRVTGLESEGDRVHGAAVRMAKDTEVDKEHIDTVALKLTDSEVTEKDLQALLDTLKVNRSKHLNVDKKDTIKTINTDESCKSELFEETACEAMRQHCSDAGTDMNCADSMDRLPAAVCMVGLHSCADLIPVMLRLYCKLHNIQSLVAVGCCYHRMQYSDCKGFKNFPLSSCVNLAVSKTKSKYPVWNLNPFAFRLAAQETRSRWINQRPADHDDHMRHVAYRAILEKAISQGIMGKRKKGKIAHDGDFVDFDSYLHAVSQSMSLKENVSVADMKIKMKQLHSEYEEYFVFIEPLTALQVLLQPVLESLIIKDRLLLLQEQGLHAQAVPVFNDSISPRNIAIVSYK